VTLATWLDMPVKGRNSRPFQLKPSELPEWSFARELAEALYDRLEEDPDAFRKFSGLFLTLIKKTRTLIHFGHFYPIILFRSQVGIQPITLIAFSTSWISCPKHCKRVLAAPRSAKYSQFSLNLVR
jgi:hypothetical protein